MFRNILIVALRNFQREKWYSLLNILGLTTGITFSLFLIFYIQDELSYDRFHLHADRLYRINSYLKEPGKEMVKLATTQFALAPQVKRDFPEVEEAVRFAPAGTTLLQNGDLRFYEDKVFFCDSNVFRAFTYTFIEGNPRTALADPKSIVLTQSVAEKFFGKGGSVVGMRLEDDQMNVYRVTGVVKDVPKNSHLIFNVLVSASSAPPLAVNWGGFNAYTYILLRPGASAAVIERKLLPYYDRFMAPAFGKFKIKIHYGVQAVPAIHLHSVMTNEPGELGDISYIYIFSAVALFMLLIASINYMNLTTARSAKRAKEIGIRKVAGSTRGQLIAQFLTESVLAALIAVLLSVVLFSVLLPVFNALSGKTIVFAAMQTSTAITILISIVVFVGFFSGSYPAIYLSKFNPRNILKGALAKVSGNVNLRRALVVVQFSISMIMLICTMVVSDQLTFLRNKDLGFNKQAVLTVTANANTDVRSQILAFKNSLRNIPNVLSVSTASAVPGQTIPLNLFSIETRDGFTQKGIWNYAIDEDYFKTLGIQITGGRAFDGISDSPRGIIVNENLVKYYGWDNPIGKRVKNPNDTSGNYMVVVGVVKDFNQQSLYNPITPMLFKYASNNNVVEVKLSGKRIPETLAAIKKNWKAAFPELPFSYSFLDQDYDSQYAADQRRGKIFTSFSILTIAITCLGLLGLIAFTTEQRRKEISIRKVMGAKLVQLLPLLIGNFILLIAFSCLIAFPVARYFMGKWLGLFSYKIALTPWPFLLAAVTVLFTTVVTVIFHAVQAAIRNPSRGLRTD